MVSRSSLAVVLAAFGFAACGGGSDTPVRPEVVAVAEVAVSASASGLTVGQTITATAATKSAAGALLTGRAVTWSTSNVAVATVTPAGVVTGVGIGKATISAASEGKTGFIAFDVGPALVQSITLRATDSSFNISGSRAVGWTTVDAVGVSATDRPMQWTVSGSEGAAVSATGVVTATRSGPVTITASADGKTGTITLGAYRPGFVTRLNQRFMLDGKSYFFGGSNSYWMLLDPIRATREANMASFKQTGGRVLRLWGSYERGSIDGSVPSVAQSGGGITIQRWDPVARRPILNTGIDGIVRLDEAVAAASANGIRLVISLVDNWPAGGGMDQYVIWYGGAFHDEFYTDARMKQAYKDYVAAVLGRVNSISGVRYADDPTILAWELANEPGCSAKTFGMGNRTGCSSANTIEPWMIEMSAYIKSIDDKHLVGTGEIGMMNRPTDAALGSQFSLAHWPNFEATIRLANIDYGTYHFYLNSDHGSTLSQMDWAKRVIGEYQTVARAANKPTILEEFDDSDPARRVASINGVLAAFEAAGGTAFLHYQFGLKKWCDPNCSDPYEVFSGTAAYDALKTWNVKFSGKIE